LRGGDPRRRIVVQHGYTGPNLKGDWGHNVDSHC
jgi:hypothetical protein